MKGGFPSLQFPHYIDNFLTAYLHLPEID